MKKIIITAASTLLLLGGGIGYAVQASADETGIAGNNTKVNYQKVELQSEDMNGFFEYEALDEIIDDDYNAQIVKDNQHKRIIVFVDNNNQPQYKSIYNKNTNRLKVIDLDEGIVVNQILGNAIEEIDYDDDFYDYDFDEDYDDKIISKDVQNKMDNLNFAEFELSVEYDGDKEFEVSIEQDRFGNVEAEFEDEPNGVDLEGKKAFNKIFPNVEKLNIDKNTTKKDALKQVVNAFSLDKNYNEIELEITFKDDHSQIEYQYNK